MVKRLRKWRHTVMVLETPEKSDAMADDEVESAEPPAEPPILGVDEVELIFRKICFDEGDVECMWIKRVQGSEVSDCGFGNWKFIQHMKSVNHAWSDAARRVFDDTQCQAAAVKFDDLVSHGWWDALELLLSRMQGREWPQHQMRNHFS